MVRDAHVAKRQIADSPRIQRCSPGRLGVPRRGGPRRGRLEVLGVVSAAVHIDLVLDPPRQQVLVDEVSVGSVAAGLLLEQHGRLREFRVVHVLIDGGHGAARAQIHAELGVPARTVLHVHGRLGGQQRFDNGLLVELGVVDAIRVNHVFSPHQAVFLPFNFILIKIEQEI